MKTNEALKLIDDPNLLNKIYQFSYHRCNTSFEAEDLCSDIILAVISSIHKQERIDNFYAFVWTIARRVYADFCEKRNKYDQSICMENGELTLASKENEIDTFIEETAAAEQVRKILSEIAFLSKAYRDIMVMYYIDEMKIKDIALTLNISETTVKQRLFSARNTVRKEVESMNNRNLSLKPIRLAFAGTGNPCDNDPRTKAERSFSQNLIYLCKKKPKTAKELSDELCVPMPFVEEELEIQCHGENGKYGTLRKLENGKYITNILLVDYSEYDEANRIYEKHLPEFCAILKNVLEQNKENILSFPYLSPQKDIRFILWSLISNVVWDFEEKINATISDKYFSDVTPARREFTCTAVAYESGSSPNFAFYGCDGIQATSIGNYKLVHIRNIYGKRIEKHFACGHNISQDPKLLMLLKAVGGMAADELAEDEKEIAAKAIECGYLRNAENVIEPNVIVIERENEPKFHSNLLITSNEQAQQLVRLIAEELAAFMRKHIPEHLMDEYPRYTQMIAGVRILSSLIEECIKEGLLSEPQNRLGAEGMLMVVEK